jgi:DNA polymerase delta subunit 1
MIKKTRDLVKEIFCKKNGYAHDTEVIYGDTDSVMIKFGVETVEEAMKLGKMAADEITKVF